MYWSFKSTTNQSNPIFHSTPSTPSALLPYWLLFAIKTGFTAKKRNVVCMIFNDYRAFVLHHFI